MKEITMPLRYVKLVGGAREKALELGVNVGLLQDEGQYEREVKGAEGDKVAVRSRDYHLLKAHGLIDEDETEIAAPVAADQPEAEEAAATSRTRTRDRGPSGTLTAVHPGGVGHQPDDGYGNDRVQAEIANDQARGVFMQAEKGLPAVPDTEVEEARYQDGRHERASREHEEAMAEHDRARDKEAKAAKEREREEAKAAKEREREEAEADKRREREAREQQKAQEKAQSERDDNASPAERRSREADSGKRRSGRS